MDDALGRSLVDALHGETKALAHVLGARLGGPEGALGARLELRANRLVALVAQLVLAVPLDLTLDIGHVFLRRESLCTRR